MTTRWWAPAGAHIGPDEKDFELLIPVDDSRHDLGAALLALHRVGAAACEEVALHALPDEVSLVTALASARQAFAAPLVESVSKSVGEGPYAGLLVRDTIDDAESGALLVFRTLVASGVPAALAAQRAGATYGVPEDGLGSYLAVAKELRAHPASLADAADRALFQAIEKIASEEAVEKQLPYEEVSKVTPDRGVRTRRDSNAAAAEPVRTPRPATLGQDDPDTDYYDARDSSGRFARGSQVGPPEVGEAPQRVKRTTRTQRTQRVKREVRAQVAVPSRKAQRKVERTVGRDVARLGKSRQERTVEQVQEILADLPDVPTKEFAAGDYMQPLDSRPSLPQLDHEVAVAMTTSEWGELQKHLGRDEDGLLAFRMGHLAQEGGVERFGAASDFERDAHRQKLRLLAAGEVKKLEDQFPGADLVKPVSVTIDDDELSTMDPLDAHAYVNEAKFDALVDHFAEAGLDPYAPEMQDLIMTIMQRQMPSNRHPDGKGDVYTYTPRMSGSSVTANIKVVELVFDAGVRAIDEGHGQHTEYTFDPNQVMRIENSRPEVIYDPRIGAFRLRYHVNPGFGKADDPRTSYFDNRDSSGQFATLSTRRGMLVARDPQAQAAEPVAAPAERSSRVSRAKRTVRPVRAKTFQPKTRSVARTINRSVARAKRRAIQEKVEQLRHQTRQERLGWNYRELREKGSYVVMPREEFEVLIDKYFTDQEEPGDPVPIYGSDKAVLIAGGIGGKHADFTMKEMTDQQILAEQYGTPYKALQLSEGRKFRLDGSEEPSEVAAKIMDYAEQLFADNEDVDQILVDYFHDGDVTFYGNMHAADPVVMVEHDPDLDPDAPVELVWDGELTTDDFIPDFDEPITSLKQIAAEEEGDDALHDALLPLKITRPKVELWRLQNVKPATDESR